MARQDLTQFRKLFPVMKRFVFMNHAGMSAFSVPVAEAMAETAQFILEHGSLAGARMEALLASTRYELSKLLNAPADHISLIKNTTDGISLVANGLSIGKGDNVVVPECEYPSNVYSWLLLREKGAVVRYVPSKTGQISAADIVKQVDKRTKLIAISYAQFFNGSRAPLQELRDKLGTTGPLVLVDGVQAAGVLPVDIANEGIECFIAGAHKWMLGPPGIGFMYVDPRWYEAIRPTRPGWASVAGGDDKVNDKMPFSEDACRYEDGTYNYVGIAGLRAAAALLNKLGVRQVNEAALSVARSLRSQLKERGASFSLSEDASALTPIVSFKLKGHKSKDIALHLASDRVIVKERRGYVRVSPHFFNDHNDVEALLRSLRRLKRL